MLVSYVFLYMSTENYQGVDEANALVPYQPETLYNNCQIWFENYVEEVTHTLLRCAVRQYDDYCQKISFFLKVPLYLAWLGSWGPMKPDSYVGIFHDYENLPLPANKNIQVTEEESEDAEHSTMQPPVNKNIQVTVEEYEEAVHSMLRINKITENKSLPCPKILVYGHWDETRKVRENITENIIYKRTERGKDVTDVQIKKGILAWALAKKWERSCSFFQLFKKNKSEQQWVVLISGDNGYHRTLSYVRQLGHKFLLVCETPPENMKHPDLLLNWKKMLDRDLDEHDRFRGVCLHIPETWLDNLKKKLKNNMLKFVKFPPLFKL